MIVMRGVGRVRKRAVCKRVVLWELVRMFTRSLQKVRTNEKGTLDVTVGRLCYMHCDTLPVAEARFPLSTRGT